MGGTQFGDDFSLTLLTSDPRLAAATKLFRDSKVARSWLGDEFVDHYACTREWEVRQFEKAVTDWELARYFESV